MDVSNVPLDVEEIIQQHNNIDDYIYETLKRAFWDKLQDDLLNKEYTGMINVLRELREKLCNLVPNRRDLHEEYHEFIDVDLIKQMLDNNAITPSYILSLVNYIISVLKQMDSLSEEYFYDMWQTELYKFLVDEGVANEVILPIFLRESYTRIELIEKHIETFKNSSMYKAILERRQYES